MAGRLTPLRRHGRALAAVTAAVLVGHGCVVDDLGRRLEEAHADGAMPPRIEVAYVREMEPAPPPQAALPAAPPPRARPRPRVRAPAVAASAPLAVADASSPAASAAQAPDAPDAVAKAQEPAASAALAVASPAVGAMTEDSASTSAPPVATSDAASAPGGGFAWPVSTKLSYAGAGWFRGEVWGQAEVEWVRVGRRYQVHLDVSGGAPLKLFERRMSSEGRLTEEGLVPERFDQLTTQLLGEPHRVSMRFDGGQVVLGNGARAIAGAGMQDSTSQFLQMTFLFSTQPGLLTPGRSLTLPVALPYRASDWTYDVGESETVQTAFGPVEAYRVAPRVTAGGRDIIAEMWFAPTLAYLPARIRLQQGREAWLDLVLERRPQLAAQ